MTKQEVFDELLEAYKEVSYMWIWEYSGHIAEDEKELEKKEIPEWKKRYEEAE